MYSVQCTVHSTFLVIFSKHLAIRYIICQFKIFYRIIVLSNVHSSLGMFFWFSLFTRSYDNEQKNLKILIKTFLLSALILLWFFTKKIWKYLSILFFSALWFWDDFLQISTYTVELFKFWILFWMFLFPFHTCVIYLK